MCQIKQEANNDSLKIIVTVFSDDLGLAICTENGKKPTTLAELLNFNSAEAIAYISSRLSIKIDQDVLNLAADPIVKIGKTRTKLTFIFPGKLKIKTLEFSNHIFFELFEDQQNLVRVTLNGQKKSAIYMKEAPDGTISLD